MTNPESFVNWWNSSLSLPSVSFCRGVLHLLRSPSQFSTLCQVHKKCQYSCDPLLCAKWIVKASRNLYIPAFHTYPSHLGMYCFWNDWKQFLIFLKKILFIHLRERERAWAGRGAEGEAEADSPLSREPDAALDPRTPKITTWAKGRCSTTDPPRYHSTPHLLLLHSHPPYLALAFSTACITPATAQAHFYAVPKPFPWIYFAGLH